MKLFFEKRSMVVLFVLCCIGCSGSDPSSNVRTPRNEFVLESEPAGAIPVGEARQATKSDEEVVLVGHIGGSDKPFVDGLAAFTIVDPKVAYCASTEGCPTPWDYCCEQNEVKKNIATVKIVDAQGKLVAKDAKALLGVKELSLVVVQGKTQRDEAGNLTLMGTKVFLKGQAK